MKEGHLPDRHKVIATAIKSFIEAQVFNFDAVKYEKLKKEESMQARKGIPINIVCPNEMYIVSIIKTFLNRYNKKYKKIENYSIIYPENIYNYCNKEYHKYTEDLIRLIRRYIENKLPVAIEELAHILFFLELGYEIKEFNMCDKYYK